MYNVSANVEHHMYLVVLIFKILTVIVYLKLKFNKSHGNMEDYIETKGICTVCIP